MVAEISGLRLPTDPRVVIEPVTAKNVEAYAQACTSGWGNGQREFAVRGAQYMVDDGERVVEVFDEGWAWPDTLEQLSKRIERDGE